MKVFMFMSGFGRRNVFKSMVLYLCVSALFILPISTLLTSLPAFADGYFDGLSTQEKYKFYVYARALDTCFVRAGSKAPNSNVEELKKGKIFNNVGDGAYVGTFPGFTGYNNSGGYFDCNSAELMSTAVSQFNIQPQGRSSAVEVLLCKIGYRRGTNYTLSEDECINGSGAFGKKKKSAGGKDDKQNDVNIYSKGKIFEVLTNLSGYKNGIENSDPGIKYLVSRSMIKGCIKDDNPQPQRHSSKDWEIPNIDGNGNATNSYYLPGDGQGYNVGGSNNREWPQNHYDANISEWQCMNIYRRLVESAPKYQEALKQSAADTACVGLAGENLKAACRRGINHKGESKYCEDNYHELDEINACKQGQSAKIETPSDGDGGGEEEKNSCGVDGIGWLVCPLMSFAGSLGDASYSAISYFLSIDKEIFKEQSNGGLGQAWSFFRDIANAVFAVIFLWVIFSQISNVGVSNYGIKKILPRLIIGALLVNLSFYICQLAVDLSNILGFSLKGVLEGAASGVGTQSAEVGTFNTLIIGGLALAGVGLFIFLAVSIPTIMALLLALLVVLVILIVRQAAVILLIAISPLAFAAWLLPNTENLFKKWVSMFRGLLIVFPVISLLYGAGKLAGAVLAAVGTDDPNNPKETMQVAALAASILPLGATPFVLQSSLNSLGNIGAKIGRMGANAHSRFAGNAKGAAKRRIDNSAVGDTKRKYSDFMDRKRASMRASDRRAKIDNSKFGRFMGWDKGGARARATVNKAFESDVDNASTMLQGMTSDKIADIANGTTVASRAMRAAAIDHTMANGSFKERMDVLSSLKGTDNSIKQRAIKAAYAKKDNNIIGNGFGDAILNDEVGSMQDLSNMAVNNAASGNLQAEHLVQNGAATKWLSDAITTSGSQQAKDAFRKAGEVAISNPNTAKNINQAISEALNAHGVVAHNTPQNTSSYNSQQNSQGSSPQQSPQNSQQSNSSSGGIIIPSNEDVNKYGR
jgi:hypothetical protein cdiviTM7_00597